MRSTLIVSAALNLMNAGGGAETPAQTPVDAAGEAEFFWSPVLLSLFLATQKKKSLSLFSGIALAL